MAEPISTGTAVAAGIDAAVGLVKTYAPKFIEAGRTWLFGKKLLLLGPGESGKSSFIEYLLLGELPEEGDTRRTSVVKKTGLVVVKYGRDQRYKLRVKYAIDTSGQTGATDHAQLAYNFNPDLIIIVLDINLFDSTDTHKNIQNWSQLFTKDFERLWINNSDELNSNLQGIIVVLNKLDKLNPADAYVVRKDTLENIYSNLVHSTKSCDQLIKFKKGVFVKTQLGSEYAQSVLTMICKIFLNGAK